MWHLWFEIGGLFFWSVVALEFLLFSYSRGSYESSGWSGLTIFLTIGIFLLFSNLTTTSIYQYAIHHPLNDILYILGYVVVGAIWSLFYWAFVFLPNVVENYKKCLSLDGKYDPTGSKIANLRSAKNNSGRIIDWMIFWPFSIVNAVFGEMTYRVYKWIYSKMGNIFQAISDKVAKNAGL